MLYRPRQTGDLLQISADPAVPLAAVKWDPRLFGVGAQNLPGRRQDAPARQPAQDPSMAGFGLEVTGYLPGLRARFNDSSEA